MARQWMDVHEAAEVLGISAEAVRKRVQRHKLEGRHDGRTLYVRLDEDQIQSRQMTSDLIEELRRNNEYLQSQVEEEREARRRADHIIARLSESNAELSRTVRELEAADHEQESEEASHTPSSQPAQGDPVSEYPEPSGEAHGSAQRRSWWQRLLGR